MTTEFEKKLAELLPDAQRELELAQQRFVESSRATRLLEQEFREAKDLVATLTAHAERAQIHKQPEQTEQTEQTEQPAEPEEPKFELQQESWTESLDRSPAPPQQLRRGEQRARVVKFVEEQGRPVEIAEVAEAFGDDRNRIGSALWKAAGLGLIRKLDNGLYAPKVFVGESEDSVMSP